MFHKYPYSNFHELNLDWILEKITEFEATLKEWSKIAEELEKALGQIETMQLEIDDLDNRVDNLYQMIVDLHVEEILEDLAHLKTAISQLTNKTIDLQNQIDDINQKFNVIEKKFNQVYVYIDGEVSKLYAYVNEKDYALILKMNQMKQQLLSDFNDLKEEVENMETTAINPWHPDYVKIGFKKNLDFIYNDLSDHAVSASEYSETGLTADEYAALEIPAIQYCKNGRKLLHLDWVFSPGFGWRQEISNVLTSIINFIQNTYTAAEYHSLDLDADAYSLLNLTAAQYYNFRMERLGVYVENGTLKSTQYALLEQNGVGYVEGATAVINNGVISFE